MSLPSREFMIRQSCLNAAVDNLPSGSDPRVVRYYLDARTQGGTWLPVTLKRDVLNRFRAIRSRGEYYEF